MSDSITILRSLGLNLCKVWKSDGTIEPYSKARNFTVSNHIVENIHDLSSLLYRLESTPHACIIRGAQKHANQPEMRRLIENVDDNPLHTILIEVDDYRPLICDPLTETEDAALEYVAECLPEPFHGASFHWQASNSMGAPGKEGLLKLHCWFWLETPYDSATLRAWATSIALQADKTVLNPVQVHYTAAPVFEPGRVDPVPQRSGFYQGTHDSVDLKINTDDLSIRPQGERQRGERLDLQDPVANWIEDNWETFGTLRDGGLIVLCPFEDGHHGGAKGDTSTAYFPAGTGGYSAGRWVCKHDSCHGRSQGEFNAKAGYNPLAVLAAPEPQSLNAHKLNERIVDLPGFQRDGKGAIEPLYNNIRVALGSPHFAKCELSFDSFRDEIVVLEEGQDEYRPFVDKDYATLRLTLETNGFKPVKDGDVRSLTHWTAGQNSFDSARFYLESLRWDGVERIETFWVKYFGVTDSPYARACGRYAWTALAGRAMDSGCQADMVPVLIGAQGLRKSRGVAAMAPMETFATTMSFHEPEVERARKMRGTLVVELAELQGLKSREREEILAWITRSVEHWTPKYKEMSTTYGRRFICFATSNEDDFLDNPNGERRWLPLRVERRVDTDGIAKVCEQLWAEGLVRYLESGIAWQDAERLAVEQHAAFKSEDSWASAVTKWLDHPDMSGETPRKRSWLTLQDVAEGALSMPARTVRFGDQRRLGQVMRSLGFELSPRKVNGRSEKVWCPVKDA